MWDLVESRKRALVRGGWIFGDRYFRIGNPFDWVDGTLQLAKDSYKGDIDLLQWISGYYEEYPTMEELLYPKHDDDLSLLRSVYQRVLELHFPWLSEETKSGFEFNLKCHALARIQDYAMLNKFAPDLTRKKSKSLSHVDFGAGIGGASTYSRYLLDSTYTAIEAHDWSYDIQRVFFRATKQEGDEYLDLLTAELLNDDEDYLRDLVNRQNLAINLHHPSSC